MTERQLRMSSRRLVYHVRPFVPLWDDSKRATLDLTTNKPPLNTYRPFSHALCYLRTPSRIQHHAAGRFSAPSHIAMIGEEAGMELALAYIKANYPEELYWCRREKLTVL